MTTNVTGFTAIDGGKIMMAVKRTVGIFTFIKGVNERGSGGVFEG